MNLEKRVEDIFRKIITSDGRPDVLRLFQDDIKKLLEDSVLDIVKNSDVRVYSHCPRCGSPIFGKTVKLSEYPEVRKTCKCFDSPQMEKKPCGENRKAKGRDNQK